MATRKRFLTLSVLLMAAVFSLSGVMAALPLQAEDFAHRQRITIGSEVVIGGPHENFPFLFSSRSPELAHTSHGGGVSSQSGYDIIFKGPDDDLCGGPGSSPCALSHEIEHYDPATGELTAWVKIPSLANGRTFYIYYGNSGITSPTERPNEVWDDKYIAVYHLREAAGDAKNSASSRFHLTRQNAPTRSPGKIGYGQELHGGPDRFDSTDSTQITSFTIEAWVSTNDWQQDQTIVDLDNMTEHRALRTYNESKWFLTLFSEEGDDGYLFDVPKDSTWHHVAVSYDTDAHCDGVFHPLRGFVDGQEPFGYCRQMDIGTIYRATISIGWLRSYWGYYWKGKIDEVRVSRTARSPGWIMTGYSNQHSPSTFYTLEPDGVNHAPVAQDQGVATSINSPVDITLSASDADGDPLSYAIVTLPVHGTLTGTPPSLAYAPTPGYQGMDSFSFQATDGKADGNVATVSITISGTNTAPVAQDQGLSTDENTPVSITLLAADSDGDALSYAIITQPAHGTLSGTPPDVTYTPIASFNGSDSFTFRAYDGKAYSNDARVSITINPIVSPPPEDFACRQRITIGSNVVSGGPHANFPFLFHSISPELAHTSHGGRVSSDSGNDIIFKGPDDDLCGDPGTSPCALSHEIEHYDPATGELVAWVKIPSLANGRTFYLYYGNGSISSPTEKPNDVWDSDYIAVYHMKEAAGDARNSASESFHLTRQNNPAQTPGKIGYAQDLNGSSDRFDGADPTSLTSFTIEAWVSTDNWQRNQTIVDVDNMGDHRTLRTYNDTKWFLTLFNQEGDDGYLFDVPGDRNWHHLAATYDATTYCGGTNHPLRGFVDGREPSGYCRQMDIGTISGATISIGWLRAYWDYYWKGKIDEVRISGVARSPGWILTGHRNQQSPSTFYTLEPDELNHVPLAYDQAVTLAENTEKTITLGATDEDGDFLTYEILTPPASGALVGTPPDVTYTPIAGFNGSDRFTFRACDGKLCSNAATVSITVWPADTKGIITTVAGNGASGYNGDNLPAIEASLDGVEGVAVDASGNLYIVDRYNSLIRKVDANGIITTVAGGGIMNTDGWPATDAALSGPVEVAVDVPGNLYIAETCRVRKVNDKGIIATLAGSSCGYGGDGGPATQARLHNPRGVAVDSSGNVYIADGPNYRIRKVDASGLITTVAGNGQSGYSGDGGPATEATFRTVHGVALDASGNLYVADGNNCIRKIDALGRISTIAGNGMKGYGGDGGPATEAMLDLPVSVAVDLSGNLYIADEGSNRIRKVDKAGIITTIAGNGIAGYAGDNGPATLAQLRYPMGVAADGFGNLYIADYGNNRVRVVKDVFPALNGTIAGRITDASTGLALSDVSVTITQPAHSISSRTDSNGRYSVAGLVQGSFTATFLRTGYLQRTLNGEISAGETRTMNVQLVSMASLGLTILSPQDGATVNLSPITVSGDISTSARVTVNGIQASVTGNAFSASVPLEEGPNQITATATDPLGQTASQSITVTLSARASIVGTVIDTSTGRALQYATASIADAANTVRSAFTDNVGVFIIKGLSPGALQGSVSAPGYTSHNVSGTIASGQTIQIRADLTPIPPTISNVALSAITDQSATITWTTDHPTDTFVQYGITPSYGGWGKNTTLTTDHSITFTRLAPGTTYHFRITSTNTHGFSSASEDQTFRTLMSAGPITVTIICPADGAIVNTRKTTVRGTTYSLTNDVGVQVNGLHAEISGCDWTVNALPLGIGTNTITAVATDALGNKDTKTVIVQTDTFTECVDLSTNLTSGIAPMQVSFSVTTANLVPVSYQIDFEGDGTVDFTGATFDGVVHVYPDEGIYFPRVTVTDHQGTSCSDTIVITVLSKFDLEGLLRARWELMKRALREKDIPMALSSFLETSRDTYEVAFSALIDELPQIVSEMQDIEMIYLHDNVAKFRIIRIHEIGGILQPITYYIYFAKDPDGLWRIDRF